jgi:prepilin-type N-terminal cleavage/methylation domain-containing protein
MKKQHLKGFTIVELLIVIVVIGILAAITIVAYNGIQERARVATVTSDLSGAARQLAVYEVDAGSYPATLSAANNGQGIKASDGTTYQYSASGATYCLTATKGTTSYKVSNIATTPAAGGCAGHGVGGIAAITNIDSNPSFEAGLGGGYTSYNSAPLAIVSSGCYVGSQCASVNTSAGANRGIIYQTPTASTLNATYVYSIYAKGTPGQVVVISARPTDAVGAYIGEGAGGQSYTLSSSWQRLQTQPVVLQANATRPGFQIRANVADPTPFVVDAAMITETNSVQNYADGNSPNWIWNGTVNSSTSTGPAL